MILFSLAAFIASPPATAQVNVNWSALGYGTDGEVFCSAIDPANGNLYIGGTFSKANSMYVSNIAMWDGTSWDAMTGKNGGSLFDEYIEVDAIAIDGDNIYVGGAFYGADDQEVHNVAKYNKVTHEWSGMGGGTSSVVSAIAVDANHNVYIGGDFTEAGGVTVNHIAKWNGTNWTDMGGGVSGDPNGYNNVYAITISGTDVYIGGEFAMAGTIAANGIAKWNGTTWKALGGGLTTSNTGDASRIYTILLNGTDLYAGGHFDRAGSDSYVANSIAKWSRNSWSAVGNGLDDEIYSLELVGTHLYAGGYFLNSGTTPIPHLAEWDGTVWSAIGGNYQPSDYIGSADFIYTPCHYCIFGIFTE